MNIGMGVIISFLVSGLKSIPYLQNHPKIVALILSILGPAGLGIYQLYTGHNVDWMNEVLSSIAIQFATSVATHETITHTVIGKDADIR